MMDTVAARPRFGVQGRLALAALTYTAVAASLSWHAFVALLGKYMVTQFFALPLMLLFGLSVASVIARPSAPMSYLWDLIRKRGIGAAWVIGIFCAAIAAFSTFKYLIPAWVPFFADRTLADLDEVLHLGHPWRHLHAITPSWISPALGLLYGPIWFAQFFGFVLFAAFLPNTPIRVRYLLSFAATLLLLGTVLRALGSSAGPIFYDRMYHGDRFADLLAALASVPLGTVTLSTSDYLYASYIDDSAVFGVGISAMPSIHVAIAFLNALFLSKLNKRLGIVGWMYAASILYGSVYFGWHYALDGYVSIIGVLLIWRHAGRNNIPAIINYRAGTPLPPEAL